MEWISHLENDDEVLEIEDYKVRKDALLIAIHVTQNAIDNGTLQKALEAALEAVTDRIVISPQDFTGVVLFGASMRSDDDADSDDESDTHFILKLGLPTAAQIKRLKRLAEDPDLGEKFVVQETPNLMDVFFDMNRHFINMAPNFSSRRIIYITDEDSPTSKEDDINKTRVRIEDLSHLKVKIEPLLINPSEDKTFDSSKFYALVFNEDTSVEPVGSVDIKQFINKRNVLNRSLFNVKMELGQGLDIGVRGYLLYAEQKTTSTTRKAWVYTGGEKPELVKLESQAVTIESGRSVDKADLRKTFKFGNDYVPFTQEQLAQIRYFGEPVVRILGFHDYSEFSDLFIHSIRSSMFLYPTDEKLVGSIRAFSALYQSLKKKDKVALTWVILRKGAKPILALLIPSTKDIEGLHMVFLPFADDIRQEPQTEVVSAPPELVDATKKIFSRLLMPNGFESQRYPNPRLQWHYRVVRAMALQEEVPTAPEDKTTPKYRSIDTRVGDYITEWNQVLQANSKRPVEAEVKPTKKVKSSSDAGAPSNEQVAAMVAAGAVGKMTVAELKAWGAANNVEPKNGKLKKDWVEVVTQYHAK
ncbi:ATP-dependent DNA helicase II subunit 1 [Yarrowia sp. C11]|nr:ATP-dependent DNA helicase II subunit 1 [Yarrowia sp. E02]KAG5373362.1 ATP-dependent DNA helicase II subunit 1 [Yarrowia sp. C11]